MPPVETHRFVYLDNNATTPCAPEVLDGMLPYFTREYGNPASPHRAGKVAAAAVATARESVAAAVGASGDGIVFTSGATEANNLAILGTAKPDSHRRKVLVSTVEHKSVSLAAKALAGRGYTVLPLPVDGSGVVLVEAAEDLIDAHTHLVCVQAMNNETGAIQPLYELVKIAHRHGALFHCDAAQALGKMQFDVVRLDLDLVSLSAHKAYGPKGVGALVLGSRPRTLSLAPLMYGGGQEARTRPGSLNVPGIVGFGCACRLAQARLEHDGVHISRLRAAAETTLTEKISGARVNGVRAVRGPGTISLTIPGVPADMLIANLTDVCIGEGSACNSGAPEPSHVLLAMGVTREDAECTVRISLGRYTSEDDLRYAVDEVVRVAADLSGKLYG